MEPTFDRDGYPTEETLAAITAWEIKTFADCVEAMDFVGGAWKYPEYWEKTGGRDNFTHKEEIIYIFSTGGWSGNESLVSAIEGNAILQSIGAWSWRRGGHYEYRFPID